MNMSVDPEKIRESFADQLSSFDDKLRTTVDDVELLAEIQSGIGTLLLANADNESEIRDVLQQHYNNGTLRKETFQLVESILDAFVTEQIPTEPTPQKVVSIRPEAEEQSAQPAEQPDFSMTQKIDMDGVLGPPGDHGVDPVEAAVAEAKVAMTASRGLAERRDAAVPTDDGFSSTTVIPEDAAENAKGERQVQVGSVLRDRFLLQEKVAGGSMGVVYKALDRRLAEAGHESQWVAIKVLSPKLAESADALRALQQEAAKGRCLIHPHIVRFIDLDRDDDLYFIVMEWLEGRTLASVLDSRESETIDVDTAFRIVRQVGDALAYAHRCGIVHADVKPGNIMILPNGDARLFDFGIARIKQRQAKQGFDPGVLGAMTAAYSSMQVLTGDEPVASDDVFSLACLLYRLVAGHRVFGPRNAAEASQEGMAPQPVSEFSNKQWAALKKALSYSRVTRFGSIDEFLEALEDSGEDSVSIAVPPRFLDEPPRRRSRAGWLFTLLLLVSGVGAWQGGYLDPLLERVPELANLLQPAETGPPVEAVVAEPETDSGAVDQAAEPTEPAEAEVAAVQDDNANGLDLEIADNTLATDPNVVGPASNLVDFSTLPEPDIIVPIAPGIESLDAVTIAVMEDSEPAIIDFVRDGDLSTELNVRLEEVGFSGNRSPWAAGAYTLSNDGLVRFPVGQERGRVTLTMASDPLREADQQSTLRVRELDDAGSELSIVQVVLQDDDQRTFEAQLPVDTIAFAAGQASIRESDPAVQIDIVRFNPSDQAVVVEFSVQDITATDGEDYFAPGSSLIGFGPRQRSARILIPLVRDSILEGDEAFVVELDSEQDLSAVDVYQRMVVMIRDNER